MLFTKHIRNSFNRKSLFSFDWVKTSPVATGTAMLFANTVLIASLGLVFWMVAARYYSIASIGLASALFAFSALVSTCSNLGLNTVVVRYLPNAGGYSLRLSMIATLIPAVLAFLFSTVFLLTASGHLMLHDLSGNYLKASLVLVVMSAATSVILIQDGIFIARQQPWMVLLRGMAGIIVRFALLIPMAKAGAFGLVSIFTAEALTSLVLGFSSWLKLPNYDGAFDHTVKELTLFGITNYVSGIFTQAPQRLYTILIAILVSSSAAGIFDYAWKAVTLLLVLPPLAANVLMANLASNPSNRINRFRQATVYLLVVMSVLAVLLYIAGWLLLPIVLPEFGRQVLGLLPILLCSTVFFAFVRFQSMFLAFLGKLRKLLFLNGFVAIAAISLPLVLLSGLGVVGLEIGWLMSQVFGVCVVWILRERNVGL